MPFKLKLKKSRQYNVASKNVFVISVEMLDNTVVECTLSSQSLGKECLGSLCQRLGLQQPEFFGLKYISKYGSLWWVDLERPLKKQLDRYGQECLTPRLHLGVMFFVLDITLLHDEVTRNHYFLQLKADLVEGRLKCSPEQAVLLAGYSLQAEFADHDSERHTTEYLTNFAILPKSLISSKETREALLERVILAHRNLQGLTTSLAEIYYIAEIQNLEGYGQQIFSTKDNTGAVVYIGASINGVFLKPMGSSSQQPSSFRWQEIVNLVHHRRNFGIECHQSERSIQCHLEDIETAKYVWRMCALQHRFYSGQRTVSFPKNSISHSNESISMVPSYSVHSENSNQLLASQESLDELGVYYTEEEYRRENVVVRPEDIRLNMTDSAQLGHDQRSLSRSRLNMQPKQQLQRQSYEANLNSLIDPQLPSVQHLPPLQNAHHSNATQVHFPAQVHREENHVYQPTLPHFHSSQEIKPSFQLEEAHPQTAMNNSQICLQGSQMGSVGDLGMQDYGQRVALPSYRQAPDYETAIRHKYGVQSVSTGDVSVTSSGCHTRASDSQPSLGGIKNAQLYAHYKNYVDLSHIESMNSIADAQALQNVNCGFQQHPMCYSNLTQTYSTPELNSQHLRSDLSTEQLLANIQMNAYHQCKSPPPYPFNNNVQRPSASTPDLTHNAIHHATVSPDLVSRKHVPAHSTGSLAGNGVDHSQHSLHAMDMQHSQSSINNQTHIQRASSETQVSAAIALTHPPPPYVPVNGMYQRPLQPGKFVTNVHGEITHPQSQPNNAPPSMGPMLVAAMNGLTLSPPDVVGINDDKPLSRDSRIQILESRLAEGQFFLEFEQIPKRKPMADFTASLLPENADRNRFKDVLPYEENRVRLTPSKENRTGYINASHISVSIGNNQRFYIAAQGPLPNTVKEFWQMVWEHNVSLIVMLTETLEQGKEKCHPYWPQTDHTKMQINEFQISRSFSVSSSTYVTCSLVLAHVPSNTKRSVWHIQYTDWPDHRCPQDLQGFLSFMEEIDAVRRLAMNEQPPGRGRNSPVLVHCSAGVGRSGVSILCDIMLYSLDYATETLEISKLLTQLRYQRMLTIQTLAQYKFVYSVLIQYLKNSRLI